MYKPYMYLVAPYFLTYLPKNETYFYRIGYQGDTKY
jgi:hypothetical protein